LDSFLSPLSPSPPPLAAGVSPPSLPPPADSPSTLSPSPSLSPACGADPRADGGARALGRPACGTGAAAASAEQAQAAAPAEWRVGIQCSGARAGDDGRARAAGGVGAAVGGRPVIAALRWARRARLFFIFFWIIRDVHKNASENVPFTVTIALRRFRKMPPKIENARLRK